MKLKGTFLVKGKVESEYNPVKYQVITFFSGNVLSIPSINKYSIDVLSIKTLSISGNPKESNIRKTSSFKFGIWR